MFRMPLRSAAATFGDTSMRLPDRTASTCGSAKRRRGSEPGARACPLLAKADWSNFPRTLPSHPSRSPRRPMLPLPRRPAPRARSGCTAGTVAPVLERGHASPAPGSNTATQPNAVPVRDRPLSQHAGAARRSHPTPSHPRHRARGGGCERRVRRAGHLCPPSRPRRCGPIPCRGACIPADDVVTAVGVQVCASTSAPRSAAPIIPT